MHCWLHGSLTALASPAEPSPPFSFLGPQHFPHTSFDDEVQFLDSQFAKPIGSAGKAYVLGDPYEGLQWHKYVAGRSVAEQPTYNLEICMTELGEEQAKQFFRNEAFISAERTTMDTGILALKPRAIIDDYVFEPCGYSMNGIEDTGLITIHITPEKGFSYASVEVSGFASDLGDPNRLLAAAVAIFKPGKVSMALSVDRASEVSPFGALDYLPDGYGCPHASAKKLECGGSVTYYNILAGEKLPCPPQTPTSILHHVASFLSNSGMLADSDADAYTLSASSGMASGDSDTNSELDMTMTSLPVGLQVGLSATGKTYAEYHHQPMAATPALAP